MLDDPRDDSVRGRASLAVDGADVVAVRRRTGADADRIEVAPLPAAPAVRTVTGDIERSASPGPAGPDRCATPDGAPA